MPKTMEAAERQAERSKRALAEGVLALLGDHEAADLSVTMLCALSMNGTSCGCWGRPSSGG